MVIYHYGREATGLNGFAVAGPQMVTFFFVLSGFVMMLAYGAQASLDLRRFWLARVARIVPAYWLALLLSLLLALYLHRQPGLPALLLHAALLQAWWPPDVMAINPPGWSLSAEAAFYLMFPAWLAALQKSTVVRSVLLAVLLWLATQVALMVLMQAVPDAEKGSWAFNAVLYHPLSHLCSFVLGMVAGQLHARRPVLTQWWQYGLLSGLSLTLLVCVGSESRLMPLTGIPFAYGASFWAPAFAAWIVLFAALRNGVTRFFAQRWAVHGGDISYGVYIYQAPLHLLWVAVLHRGTGSLLWFCLFVLVLLLLAHLSYEYFERPLQGWIRQRRGR